MIRIDSGILHLGLLLPGFHREEPLLEEIDIILELTANARIEAVDYVPLQIPYNALLRCAILQRRILQQSIDLGPLLRFCINFH